MKKSGIYRSIYSRLPDTPEFRILSPEAKLLFYTMRVSRICNLAGIFVCENGEIMTLAEQTGLGFERVKELFPELEKHKWIIYKSPIMWIINALRHDPGMKLETNEKQKKGIVRVVMNLPKLPIITSFFNYYNLSIPNGYPDPLPKFEQTSTMALNFSANNSPSIPSPYPIEGVSKQDTGTGIRNRNQEQDINTIGQGPESGKPNNNYEKETDPVYKFKIKAIIDLLGSKFKIDPEMPITKICAMAGQILNLGGNYEEAAVGIVRASAWVPPTSGDFMGAIRLELKRRGDGGWSQDDWDAVKEQRIKFDQLLDQEFPNRLKDVINKIGRPIE